jgi:hypothetical protein
MCVPDAIQSQASSDCFDQKCLVTVQEGGETRVAQWSKALHLSARGVSADTGLISGCTTTGRDWSPIRQHTIGPVSLRFGQGRPSL